MINDSGQPLFTAIVLAADREADNPVAQAAGVLCKSLAPVGGRPMILRVLEALSSAEHIGVRTLCGPPKPIMDKSPQLSALVASGKVRWLENHATPSASAYHAMQSLPMDTPVLLTTSDHALLSPRIIDHFCAEAMTSGCDVVAALALRQTVTDAYPETRRTAYHLGGADYCSCNLFAFLTPQARSAAQFWRKVENQRKKPLRVIKVFGAMAIIRYLLGRLTLAEALDRISSRLGFKVGVVLMPFPEAAIDVDTASDWDQVKQIAAAKDRDHTEV